MTEQKFRIFVLGAGFSKPAGFPLASDLWAEIYGRAEHLGEYAGKFKRGLGEYIEFYKDCFGTTLSPAEVNFEDFMRYLDIEHFLRLRGSDTWSNEEGNEETILTKILIAHILYDRLLKLTKIPDEYLAFAAQLQPGDTVITFNYDTLLEASLDAVGSKYRLFRDRYSKVDEHGALSNLDDDEEVVILKVHGSIDWFSKSTFDQRSQSAAKLGRPTPSDPIFNNPKVVPEPITSGPRFPDDPLKNVYRVRNLKAVLGESWGPVPRILAPSAVKYAYMPAANDFFFGAQSGGGLNLGMAIIGYSLPAHDDYALQVLHSLVTNYQRSSWANSFGKTKLPLVVVDLFSTPEAERDFKNRYKFVDWSQAALVSSGFSNESVPQIFS